MGSKTDQNIIVSVIIVNYNNFGVLDECLSTLIKSTSGLNYEVIVIDNNSTCGNVEEVTCKYSDVILIKNSANVGFAAANNIALKHAKGKYILFLNNDTVFYENTILNVLEFAEKQKGEIFIGCKLLNSDKSYQESIFDFPTVINTFSANFSLYRMFPLSPTLNKYHYSKKEILSPIEVDVITGAFIFCRAESIRMLGGFDERFYFYAEEIDLCYRFKKSGGKVFYLPTTSIIHLGGATTDTMPWFKYKNQAIASIQFFQKHFKGIDYLLVILFHYMGLLVKVPVSFAAAIVLRRKYLFVKAYYLLKQAFVYPKNIFE